jgi:putative peptide zinc metalloprotease protein
LQLLGDIRGSGYRHPPALVRRADGQTLQVTGLLYRVLEAVDGHRNVEQIASEVSRNSGRAIDSGAVRTLIDTKLRPLGMLRRADGSEPQVRRANPLLALKFRVVVSKPELTRRITAPFAWLFHPLIVVAVVAGFVAVCYWVLFERGLGLATHQAFANPALLLAVFGITLASAGFHEFGHAAAARYGGATPGAMGAGLYLLWPAFYTDVTDSYRLGRAGRIRTDLGGLYFNAVLAVAIFGVWALSRWDALLLAIATQILQMIRQLPPLLRFDGYHLLADLTGVPDLFYRIKPTLLGWLPWRWGNPETKVLKPWAKAAVTLWVIAVVPFMVASLLFTVLAMPRILATAASSLDTQWRAMAFHFHTGDFLAGLAKLLGALAITLPAGGIVYLVVRLVRQTVTKVWRATTGKPIGRAVATLTGAAVVAGLVFAWWPHGNYRPIQPNEKGRIQDIVPTAAAQYTHPQRGQTSTAVTVWADTAGPLSSVNRPVLALVLVPRPGSPGAATAPTWVFPFNRPAPPGPGDNQSLAINTTNGATVYKVAFALVWVDPNRAVLNRNEAYALASCQHCQTMAVSFQVVLVIGQAHIVAPQNIAAAINYHCLSCLTQALAMQLVITLPGPPTQQETAAIDSLWQQITAFAEHLQGLTFSQIRARLLAYEHQTAAVITRYPPAPTTTAPPVSTSPITPVSTLPATTVPSSSGSTPSTSPDTSPSDQPSTATTGSTEATSTTSTTTTNAAPSTTETTSTTTPTTTVP